VSLDLLSFWRQSKTGTLKLRRGAIVKHIYLETEFKSLQLQRFKKNIWAMVLLHYGRSTKPSCRLAMEIHAPHRWQAGSHPVVTERLLVSQRCENPAHAHTGIIYDLLWEEAHFDSRPRVRSPRSIRTSRSYHVIMDDLSHRRWARYPPHTFRTTFFR